VKAAIVGRPVAHSLSPAIWQAAYDSLGLAGWTYDSLDVDDAGFVKLMRSGDYAGLSVTMPYKHAAARQVDRVVGRTAGAVNTVVFTEEGSVGHNTDVDGVRAALERVSPSGLGKVVVLGAGGTASAAVLAALAMHAKSLTIVARNAGPANALRERTGNIAHFAPWTHAVEEVQAADVVVNATPRGAADELAPSWTGAALVEVLYDPWPTPIAKAASVAGNKVVGGLYVLVHQAVRQIELVTGARPDSAVLLAAGEAAARAR
jgi:shikimate dehydrogenase